MFRYAHVQIDEIRIKKNICIKYNLSEYLRKAIKKIEGSIESEIWDFLCYTSNLIFCTIK